MQVDEESSDDSEEEVRIKAYILPLIFTQGCGTPGRRILLTGLT